MLDFSQKGYSYGDLVTMANQISLVRETGATNMFDRNGVCQVLEAYGYHDTAECIKSDKNMFLQLLKISTIKFN